MDHLKEGYPFTFRVMNHKRKQKKALVAANFGGYTFGCKGATTLRGNLLSQKETFDHVLLVVKSGKFFLYINGKMANRKGSGVFCSTANEAPLRIGKRGGSDFQNHFAGAVDNLAIYNRALSDEEITIVSNREFDLEDILNTESKELVKSDTLFFDDNVFKLTSKQRVALSDFHKYLEVGNQYYLLIEGHSNGIPDDDFCDELSFKRAKVVEDYLKALGVSCNKITTKGLGKRKQIASNKSHILRKKNQRAEISLYKIIRA